MGLFDKSFPHYIIGKYFPGRIVSSFRNGVIFRYICPSCEKHFNEKVPRLSGKLPRGIPFRRTCTYCGGPLKIENVFEDRRTGRGK
jgi:rRNA maturation endonuclease Nob1